MKILMLTYEVTDRGGNFIRCFSLAKNLVKLGHQVTLFSGSPKMRFTYNSFYKSGVRIVETPDLIFFRFRHDGWSPFQIIFRCIFMLHNKYGLIHGFGHRPSVSFPVLFAKYFLGRLCIADWADLWGKNGVSSYYIRGPISRIAMLYDIHWEQFYYNKLDGLTVICSYLKKTAKKLQISSSKMLLLPPGADINDSLIITKINKTNLRHKLNLPTSKFVITYAGNTDYDMKLLTDTVEALIKINRNVLLLYIGNIKPLQKWMDNKKYLREHIITTGYVNHDELHQLLKSADIAFLPYSKQSVNLGRFPNKLGDYLAAGLPIVTNPTGDIEIIFRKNKIGILSQSDSGSMAKDINRLLNNQRLQTLYSHNACKFVSKTFNWLQRANDLSNFYHQVLTNRSN